MAVSNDAKLQEEVLGLEESANLMYMVICGAMIFLMQVGFGFLEAGCVRYKNLQSIIIKIFLNTCFGIVLWWIIGYGIAFGTTKYTQFVGQSQFVGENLDKSEHFSHWVFQTAIAVAANSIVSGGAAERMTFFGYVGLSIGFSGLIYPFAAHWGFHHDGWLIQMGYHDFAGSGTVHAVGGVGALMTTIFLKPRKDRFNPRMQENFEPNNPTYVCLASLSLWTCWIFFNAGSTLGITDGRNVIMARAAMNTMVSASSGTITVFLLHYFINITSPQRWSLVMLCNGNLAGLVAVTAYIHQSRMISSCDNIEPWAAFVIGILGGFEYIFLNRLLYKLQIDDPVDAVPIHFGCGILGTNLVAWFDMDNGILYGHGGKQFGLQLLGTISFLAWSGILHFIFLSIIKACNLLRISPVVEAQGIDFGIGSGGSYNYSALPQKAHHPIDMQETDHHDTHHDDHHAPLAKKKADHNDDHAPLSKKVTDHHDDHHAPPPKKVADHHDDHHSPPPKKAADHHDDHHASHPKKDDHNPPPQKPADHHDDHHDAHHDAHGHH